MDLKEYNKVELIKQITDLQEKLHGQSKKLGDLESNSAKWKSIFKGSPNQILIIDSKGILLDINFIPEYVLPKEAFIGKSAYDFISQESKPQYIETVNRVFKTRKADTIEITGKNVDNVDRWYFSTLYPVIENNQVNSVIIFVTDITDKKLNEFKLREANNLLTFILEKTPAILWGLDRNLNITLMLGKGLEKFGLKPNQLVGASIYNVVKTAAPSFPKEKIRLDAIHAGKSTSSEQEFNGKMYKTFIEPVFVSGKIAGSLGLSFDISDIRSAQEKAKLEEEINVLLKNEISQRKKIESELKSSKEKYQNKSAQLTAIIESSSHMFWTMNRKTEVLTHNKNFEKLFLLIYGILPKVGSNLSTDFVSTEENNRIWMDKAKAAFKGSPQYMDLNFLGKGDQQVWLEIYLNPIYNEKGKVVEVSAVAHDITDKKLSEEKIKKSLVEKEVLLKEIHHRVKNNLQVISSILNLQSTFVKDSKTLEILRESQNRIKSMSYIHESLYRNKDFSSINFQEYVENLTANLLFSYSSVSKKISLKQKVDNVFLNLDVAIPLGLIINELMSNALKYAFANRSRGLLEIRLESVGNSKLRLIVSDNGTGFPTSVNFKRTESLGLQLVNILVDQLEGTIKLETNKGTRFIITFNKKSLKL